MTTSSKMVPATSKRTKPQQTCGLVGFSTKADFLDLIDEHLPIGGVEWDGAEEQENLLIQLASHPGLGNMEESLKHSFVSLLPPSTSDPKCLDEVIKAMDLCNDG